MLLEFKTMTDEQIWRLVHEVYSEGCVINAKYHHPEQEDLSEAIEEEAEYFFRFLKEKFLPQERNTYYVLEVEGEWVSGGFRIEQEEAVNCLSGETRADYYGLIYQES